MLKSLNKFKLRGVEDLPTQMEIYIHFIEIALLEHKTGEIISSTYLTSIVDIVGNCSNLGNGALLIINGYALGVIWGKNCFFLFDLYSKNSSGNICQNGTSVLLKFDSQELLNLLDVSAIDETEADSSIVENESFVSVDGPLNAHRAAVYETTLVPEIPRIIEDDNVIMAPGQGKTPVSVLNDVH